MLRPFRTFTVIPSLPSRLSPLPELAYNLWWTWNLDAVDLFRRLLPIGKDPDQYLVEPYVFSQFVAGPSTGPQHGRGAYHWLTGTAAWMIRAMLDYIIGVRTELNGLRINPAVDPSWTAFKLRRQFRGATYTIEVENPQGVQTGVTAICLDGQPIELLANIELPGDAVNALEAGAVGVGLFRSEFLFMNRDGELPDEDEQFEAYRAAVLAMAGLPVTIRTVYIGADKP